MLPRVIRAWWSQTPCDKIGRVFEHHFAQVVLLGFVVPIITTVRSSTFSRPVGTQGDDKQVIHTTKAPECGSIGVGFGMGRTAFINS